MNREMRTAVERSWAIKFVIIPFAGAGILLLLIMLLSAFGPRWVSNSAIWLVAAVFIVYIVINIIGEAKTYL